MPKDNKDAVEIAAVFRRTDTDYRGNLLIAVAEHLRGSGQYYTASVIETAGHRYNAKA